MEINLEDPFVYGDKGSRCERLEFQPPRGLKQSEAIMSLMMALQKMGEKQDASRVMPEAFAYISKSAKIVGDPGIPFDVVSENVSTRDALNIAASVVENFMQTPETSGEPS